MQRSVPACNSSVFCCRLASRQCMCNLVHKLVSLLQAVLYRRYVLAALAAAAAVGVRQNNAVWAAFSLGVIATSLAPPGLNNCRHLTY